MAKRPLQHADQVRGVSEGQRRNYRQKKCLALHETRSQAMSKKNKPVRPATLKKDIRLIRLALRHAKYVEEGHRQVNHTLCFQLIVDSFR
jgi:hypothetical protein